MPSYAISVDQIKINADGSFKGLDEVRLFNTSDVLYCKEGVTTGIICQNSVWKLAPVTWNNGVPAVNTTNAKDLVSQSDLEEILYGQY